MLRLAAKSACLLAGGAAGYFVYRNMFVVFEGYAPWIAAISVGIVVFVLFYFPLLRPVADAISDRLSVAVHRGRHIRSGSGLEELPTRSSMALRCTICGEANGPICASCQADLDRGRRSRF